MYRDSFFALLMAMAVALVPNALVACIAIDGTIDSLSEKIALIFGLAIGPALVAPFVFGRALPSGALLHRIWFPIALVVAGIAGAAYLLAVVGLGESNGLGAGFAEMLDSSLAPIFYIGAVVFAGSAPLTLRLVSGLVLCLAGVLVVSVTVIFAGQLQVADQPQVIIDGWLLIPFGVLGAAGTACSLWLLRRLVRRHGASLGACIALRYGGVAAVFLLIAVTAIGGDNSWPVWGMIAASVAGAILIPTAFYAAVSIECDVKTAAGMASIPLFAFWFEGLLALAGVVSSSIPFMSPLLWTGVTLASFGVWFLQRDPAAKKA